MKPTTKETQMLAPLAIGDRITAQHQNGRYGWSLVVEARPSEGSYVIEHPDGTRETIRDSA